jgi:transposase
MTTPETALQGKDTAVQRGLSMSMELGERQWKLALGNGVHAASRFTVPAGDTLALLRCIEKAKARFGLPPDAPVYSCYEAGRDGWWLHRWLEQQGIHNHVVDSASIEVNRRARRSKTDRLDADKLLALLLRYLAGERRVWAVARAPTVEQEDERRLHRELQTLGREHNRHTNRIGSLLVLHGVHAQRIGRAWARWWDEYKLKLPPGVRAEIERECERLALVKTQMAALERQRREQLADEQSRNPIVAKLMQLRSIGLTGAWIMTYEMFGWREFANRRQVAGCVGLTPTPYASGELNREQGISKTGNKRVRSLIVELAWLWLRLQPDSELTKWFQTRFAHGGKRMRRIGIVALARRLIVALWRYVKFGEIPAGAALKSLAKAAA